MNSLTWSFNAALSGRAKGITNNAELQATLVGRTFNLSLSSTGSGASKANNGYSGSRTLAASGTETLDLRNFVNQTNESAQSLGTLRFISVKHSSTSTASSISVGNSGANALIVKGCFGATTTDLKPGESIILAMPTSAGVTVDATHKDLKVANNDAVNSSTYEIAWAGE